MHPAKLSSKSEDKLRTLLDKQKLREVVPKRLARQEMLKKICGTEEI